MPLIASQVKPGPAHAPSTKFPEDVLPLHTVVGTQGRLVLQLSDCMGNKCIEGGAHLEVSVNTNGAPKAALTCKCDDQQDGTFLVTWSSEVSHKYMLELKIHGVHIMGSPAPLTLLPGDLEVSRCSLLAPREAVAGEMGWRGRHGGRGAQRRRERDGRYVPGTRWTEATSKNDPR